MKPLARRSVKSAAKSPVRAPKSIASGPPHKGTPFWRTPRGFDVVSVSLDLGGSPNKRQTVVAIIGYKGKSITRAVMQWAASAQKQVDDPEREAVLAAMVLVVRQGRAAQSEWPIVWPDRLLRSKRSYRKLAADVDIRDLEGGIEPDVTELGVDRMRVLDTLSQYRTRDHTDIERAHLIARWNASPDEYGTPTTDDVNWVGARAREIFDRYRSEYEAGHYVDTTAILNDEIQWAAAIPNSVPALSRLAAWRLLIEAGADSLLRWREFVYKQALADLASDPRIPPELARAIADSSRLHEMFYVRSPDFGMELFYFDGASAEAVRQRYPRLFDTVWKVFGEDWVKKLFRATHEGDTQGRAGMLADYHALAAIVSHHGATAGAPSRKRKKEWLDREDPHRSKRRRGGKEVAPGDLGDEVRSGLFGSGGEDFRLPIQVTHARHLMGKMEAAIGESRDFRIFKLHRMDGFTLDEIGKQEGITRARAHQLLKRADKRLRAGIPGLRELLSEPDED